MSEPTEPVTESAKAVQEAAKASGKAIDAARDLGHWFSGRLTPALDAAIGWALTDNLQYARAAKRQRLEARLRIFAHQTQARLEALGVDTIHAIGDRLSDRLIEGASQEDDPQLQEMWANLLASALSADEEAALLYSSILRDLRGSEAQALKAYAERDSNALRTDHVGMLEQTSLDGEAFGMEVTRSLVRLGLVEPVTTELRVVTDVQDGGFGAGPTSTRAEIERSWGLYALVLTETAVGFCRAAGIALTPPTLMPETRPFSKNGRA